MPQFSLNHFQRSRGIANLALVITVSLIMLLIIFTIQAITLLTARLAAINISDKAAFYNAEGILYDTIVRLNRGETPNDISNSPTSALSTLKLQRNVSQTGDLYQVDVTAVGSQASRKISSSFRRVVNNSPTLDIALIIDSSGSMDDLGCRTCSQWVARGHDLDCTNLSDPNQRLCQPLYSAQAAAQMFVHTLEEDPAGDTAQLALIHFANTAHVLSNVRAINQNLNTQIQKLTANGATNIQHALLLARDNLNWRSPGQAQKVIILLTDGIPNRSSSGSSTCSPPYPDSFPLSQCAQSAITIAEDLKDNQGVTIYTIGLGLESPSGYIQSGQIAIARATLESIASQPAANYAYYTALDQLEQLQDVYAAILHQLLSDPYLRIRECPSGGSCP